MHRGHEFNEAAVHSCIGAGSSPSMQQSHMDCSGPHTLGTEFVRHVIGSLGGGGGGGAACNPLVSHAYLKGVSGGWGV